MTPHEFYEELQLITGNKTVIKLSMGDSAIDPTDGGLLFKVSENDAMAAKLLLWLEDQIPDKSMWDVFEVLDAAHWWATFWTSLSQDGEDFEEVTPPPAGCHNVEMEV